jgi:hypothetical protein
MWSILSKLFFFFSQKPVHLFFNFKKNNGMIHIDMFSQYNYIINCAIYDYIKKLLEFLNLSSKLDSYNKKYIAWLEEELNQLVYY